MKDRKTLTTVLDQVRTDLKTISKNISAEDRHLLEQHEAFVAKTEKDLQEANKVKHDHPIPTLEQGVRDNDDDMPKISKMQIDLMINSFQSDFARVATLQYSNSVGGAKNTHLKS